MNQMPERKYPWWTQHAVVGLLGLGIAVYSLESLPVLLVPWGYINAALYVAVGMLLAILGLFASAIGVWYFLSDPVRSGSKLAAKISSEPGENSKEGRLKGDAPSAKSFGSDSSKGNTYSELVENMIPAAGSADLPPPSLSHDGEFSDWVYTIPCTKYDRTEALADWPPESEGEKALVAKWFAVAKGGVLLLAQKPPTSNNKFVPIVTIPLAGCRIEIPVEGLRNKSKWWKKCPIEVSHLQKVLLSQQTSFFLFASNGFAKAQWYGALSWGATGGGAARSIENMYYAFSDAVRSASSIPHLLPQVHSTCSKDADKSGQPGRWGKLKGAMTFYNKARSSKATTSGPSGGGSPLSVDPNDIDALWYNSKAGAGMPPSAASAMTQHNTGVSPKKPAASVIAPSCADSSSSAAGGKAAAATPAMPRQESVDSGDAALPETQLAVGTSAHSSADESGDTSSTRVRASPNVDSSASSKKARLRRAMTSSRLHTSAMPCGNNVTTAVDPLPTETAEARPESPAVRRSATFSGGQSAAAACDTTAQTPHRFPQVANGASRDNKSSQKAPNPKAFWAAHTEPVEAAVNMLLTRVAFDLLRSLTFRASAADYVQRKLDQIRYPPYIGPLKVVDISVGQSVPEVSNFRSLPSPDSAIWPQCLIDIHYHGQAWVIVETSFNLKCSAAWSQFEATIGQFGGESAAQDSQPALVTDDGVQGESIVKAQADNSHARKILGIGSIRKAASAIQKMADSAVKSISQIPLRLKVSISDVDGTLLAWLPPPPGDSLWTAFTDLRSLDLTAKPVVGNRMLNSTTQAMRASQWIETKLKRSIIKNMMYPACSDMRLPLLIPWGHSQVARPIPSANSDKWDEETVEGQPSVGGVAGAAVIVAANMKARVKGGGHVQSSSHLTNLEALRATAEVLAAEDSDDSHPLVSASLVSASGSCKADDPDQMVPSFLRPHATPTSKLAISSVSSDDKDSEAPAHISCNATASVSDRPAAGEERTNNHHPDAVASRSSSSSPLAPTQRKQAAPETARATSDPTPPAEAMLYPEISQPPLSMGPRKQQLYLSSVGRDAKSTVKTEGAQGDIPRAIQATPMDATTVPRSLPALQPKTSSTASESGHLVAPASPPAANSVSGPERESAPADRSSRIQQGAARLLASKGFSEARGRLGGFVSKNQSRMQELAGTASLKFGKDYKLKPDPDC